MLERSQLRLTFCEDFESEPSFFDADLAPRGRWKTNFAFGAQNSDAPRHWETRTLRPNNEQQHYASPLREPAAFKWSKGMLTIAARPAHAGDKALQHGLSYVSGLITSEKAFDQKYGYFEARVRMPVGQGLWPAFWLRPRFQVYTDTSMPQLPAEVDIFENLGKRDEVYVTVHYGTRDDKQHDSKRLTVAPVDAFHTYGALITAREIVWYVDEREVRRLPNRDFHRPAYMLLNLAVGGDWPGPPDTSTRFPASMTIDWVRAYALRDQPVPSGNDNGTLRSGPSEECA